MNWSNYAEIAKKLDEVYPNSRVDALALSNDDLKKMIVSLPGFTGDEKLNSQSNSESSVEFLYFGIRERADVIGKQGFREAMQIVAINSTVMFKTFLYSYLNLCLYYLIVIGINRCAYNCGEFCINKSLTANNQKNAGIFGVVFESFKNPVKFAAFHSSLSHNGTWYESASIASALSLSAWRLIYSISSSSVTLGFVLYLAGVKVRITGPVGTSRGTSRVIRRSAGISMV